MDEKFFKEILGFPGFAKQGCGAYDEKQDDGSVVKRGLNWDCKANVIKMQNYDNPTCNGDFIPGTEIVLNLTNGVADCLSTGPDGFSVSFVQLGW